MLKASISSVINFALTPVIIDFAYWKGGTYQDRLVADKELELCVAETGNPKIAELMLAGVRVGGTPYLPTKFR